MLVKKETHELLVDGVAVRVHVTHQKQHKDAEDIPVVAGADSATDQGQSDQATNDDISVKSNEPHDVEKDAEFPPRSYLHYPLFPILHKNTLIVSFTKLLIGTHSITYHGHSTAAPVIIISGLLFQPKLMGREINYAAHFRDILYRTFTGCQERNVVMCEVAFKRKEEPI